MQKRSVFQSSCCPTRWLLPQLAIILIFFYWPAAQAVWQSFLLQDAFGLSTTFVWFENYQRAVQPARLLPARSSRTFVFSFAVAVLVAVLRAAARRDGRQAAARRALYRTLLIWPYAVAPPVAGVLWVFMFQPSLGMLAHAICATMGVDWNPLLDGTQAMILVILAAAWKQISYNFLFFLAGLQAIPKSVIEAAAIDGARPMRRFWTIDVSAAVADHLLPARRQHRLRLLRHLRHHRHHDRRRPGKATETLVYKVYSTACSAAISAARRRNR